MVTLCAPEGKRKYGGGGKDMEEVCYPIWKIIIPGRTRYNFLINITGMEALSFHLGSPAPMVLMVLRYERKQKETGAEEELAVHLSLCPFPGNL